MRTAIRTCWVLGAALTIGCPPPESAQAPPAPVATSQPAGEAAPPAEVDPAPPPAVEPERARPVTVDLSHVVPGQRYVYAMSTQEMELEQTYEVLEVTDGAVSCRIHLKAKLPGASELTPQGEPTTFKWEAPLGRPAGEQPAPEFEQREETIEAAGRSWDCLVTEISGTRSWVPVKGGVVTFPEFIRMESPQSKALLVRIEGP